MLIAAMLIGAKRSALVDAEKSLERILRLKHEFGASDRAIAIDPARSTVRLCLTRSCATGLSWSLPAG